MVSSHRQGTKPAPSIVLPACCVSDAIAETLSSATVSTTAVPYTAVPTDFRYPQLSSDTAIYTVQLYRIMNPFPPRLEYTQTGSDIVV